jgi:hypothetical protein
MHVEKGGDVLVELLECVCLLLCFNHFRVCFRSNVRGEAASLLSRKLATSLIEFQRANHKNLDYTKSATLS